MSSHEHLIAPAAPPDEQAAHDTGLGDIITDALLAGEPLGGLRGIDHDGFESLYALGHGLYQQARYEDAIRIFGYLSLHDHMEPRFILALGASLQMAGRREEAVRVYTVAVVLDPADPVPTFHLAECLSALDRVPEALESLEMVLAQCEPGRHDALRARVEGMAVSLSRHGDGKEEVSHEY